jgi:hypothetical protein
MWAERNDHAPKGECADLFQCMPKKGNFEKNKSSLIILLSSTSLSLPPPPPKKKSLKNYYSIMSLLWTPAIIFYNTYFASPTVKLIKPS